MLYYNVIWKINCYNPTWLCFVFSSLRFEGLNVCVMCAHWDRMYQSNKDSPAAALAIISLLKSSDTFSWKEEKRDFCELQKNEQVSAIIILPL